MSHGSFLSRLDVITNIKEPTMTARLNPLAAAPDLMKTWFDASVKISSSLEPSLVHACRWQLHVHEHRRVRCRAGIHGSLVVGSMDLAVDRDPHHCARGHGPDGRSVLSPNSRCGWPFAGPVCRRVGACARVGKCNGDHRAGNWWVGGDRLADVVQTVLGR